MTKIAVKDVYRFGKRWIVETEHVRTDKLRPWYGLGIFFTRPFTARWTANYLIDSLRPSYWFTYPGGGEVGTGLHLRLNQALREYRVQQNINEELSA